MSTFYQKFKERHLPASVPSFEETGLPESYRKEYLANPWLNQVATGGFLGLGQRQQQAEIDTNSRQYISELLGRYHKEQYEDPSSAAARERAAGLNPDLLGLDQAGKAGDNPSALPFPEQDVAGQMSAVAGTMLNIASIATGIPNFVSDLQGKLIENRGKVIQNLIDLQDLVDEDSGNLKPIMDLPEDASAINVLSAAGKVYKRSTDLAKAFFPYDKKGQNDFIKMYDARHNNLKNQLSRFSSLKDLIEVKSSPEITDPEVIKGLASTYAKYQLESLKNKLWYENELAKYREANPGSTQQELAEGHNTAISQEQAAQAAAKTSKEQSEYRSKVIEGLDPESESTVVNLENIESAYRAKQNATDLKFIDEYQDYFDFDDYGSKYYKDKFGKRPFLNHDKYQQYWKDRAKYRAAMRRIYRSDPKSTRLNFKGLGLEF